MLYLKSVVTRCNIYCIAVALLLFMASCSGNAPANSEDSVTKRDVVKDSMQIDTHKSAAKVNGQRPVGDTLKK